MKTFPRSLLLTAALTLHALPRRAEGTDSGEGDKAARNLQNLLSKHEGNAIALAAQLLAENAGYRETIRTQKEDLGKAALPDGAVVLSKEQAAQWATYQALGAPAEVEKTVKDGREASERLTKLERRDTLRSVADKVGYQHEVLERLGSDLDYQEIEVDGEKAGEKVKTYGVKVNDKVVPVTQYASENWKAFLPALTTQAQGGPQRQESTVRVPLGGAGLPATGTRTPEQVAADKQASGDYSL